MIEKYMAWEKENAQEQIEEINKLKRQRNKN
mgnify:CR=1 FL=1